MDMIYDGAHGITIGDKHTWQDFKMAPTARPWVEPPGVKTEYVDIPGAHGSLDYTEILNGVKYTNRQGSWEFIINPEVTVNNWAAVYSQLLAYLQGKQFRIILDDDPEYYYLGRVSINKWKSDQYYSTIVLDYNVEPFKYPISSTARITWKWNELFSNVIHYGTFVVEGTKARNLINDTEAPVSVAITCTDAIVITLADGDEVSLVAGTTDNALTLAVGDNFVSFAGNAEVTVDYSTGRIL
ncbi:MAG: hypothetical protein IJ716_14295 [Lachnospiraceae bacterium]|nr:hypothetical protein [Lachnospiraceae bacterium]